MKVVRVGDLIQIEATTDERGIMSNALNEICNGVYLQEWDFQTRMGVEREEARAVLQALLEGRHP